MEGQYCFRLLKIEGRLDRGTYIPMLYQLHRPIWGRNRSQGIALQTKVLIQFGLREDGWPHCSNVLRTWIHDYPLQLFHRCESNQFLPQLPILSSFRTHSSTEEAPQIPYVAKTAKYEYGHWMQVVFSSAQDDEHLLLLRHPAMASQPETRKGNSICRLISFYTLFTGTEVIDNDSLTTLIALCSVPEEREFICIDSMCSCNC